MDRITICKSQCTKAYNAGKCRTIEDFQLYLAKYQITHFEYLVDGIKTHLEKLLASSPKYSKPLVKKKEHAKWYVYFYFINSDKYPIYIGKTYDIGNRLKQHQSEDNKYKRVSTILYMEFDSETDALDYERYYTEHFQPQWNTSNRREPPSYKLPIQEVKPWADKINDIQDLPKMKAEFDKAKELSFSFQTKINQISCG